MKRLWKKPAVKITAAAVVVVALALALLGLWICSLRSVPAMPFDFLKDHAAMARIEQYPGSSHYKDIMEVYSFEADYEDVSKSAYEELSGLGFRTIGSGLIGSRSRQYVLVDTTTRVKVLVLTFNKRKCVSSSSQKPSTYSSARGYEAEYLDGWVTVEVHRWPLRLWPPQHLVHGLKWRLQAIKNPPRLPPVRRSSKDTGKNEP